MRARLALSRLDRERLDLERDAALRQHGRERVEARLVRVALHPRDVGSGVRKQRRRRSRRYGRQRPNRARRQGDQSRHGRKRVKSARRHEQESLTRVSVISQTARCRGLAAHGRERCCPTFTKSTATRRRSGFTSSPSSWLRRSQRQTISRSSSIDAPARWQFPSRRSGRLEPLVSLRPSVLAAGEGGHHRARRIERGAVEPRAGGGRWQGHLRVKRTTSLKPRSRHRCSRTDDAAAGWVGGISRRVRRGRKPPQGVLAKTPEQIIAARKKNDSQGIVGIFRGIRAQYTVTFDERRHDARFTVINQQQLTTASANDTRDYSKRDARNCRRTDSGAVPDGIVRHLLGGHSRRQRASLGGRCAREEADERVRLHQYARAEDRSSGSRARRSPQAT